MKVYISYNKNKYSDRDLENLSEKIRLGLALKLGISQHAVTVDYWNRRDEYTTDKLHSADVVIVLPKKDVSGKDTKTVVDKGQETEIKYCLDSNTPVLLTWGSCVAYFQIYKIYSYNKQGVFIDTAQISYTLRHDIREYIEELYNKKQHTTVSSVVSQYTQSNQKILLILN